MTKFSIRKSTFDKFIERLGIDKEEVLKTLDVEVVKVGSGYRYVIEMESFFFFVMEKLYAASRPRTVSDEDFEIVLKEWVSKLAGFSGYANLAEVRDVVVQELGMSQEEFSEKLAALVQRKRGEYLLVEGGDRKVLVGTRKYGLIKRVKKIEA